MQNDSGVFLVFGKGPRENQKLSRYVKTQLPRRSQKTSFTNVRNTIGALVSMNRTTLYSKCP